MSLLQFKTITFLQKYKVENEIVSLSKDEQVSIAKYHLIFNPWIGKSLDFDFGNKPIIDFDGDAIFAELAILRIFINQGWDGAWIETYGGIHYLRSMPGDWSLNKSSISLPDEKEDLLKKIWQAGATKGCFDVMVWKDDLVLFCEAKRSKSDRLTRPQIKFIQGVLKCGLSLENLLIIEWDFSHSDNIISHKLQKYE